MVVEPIVGNFAHEYDEVPNSVLGKQPTLMLASRPQTSGVPRGCAVLWRGTFSGLILLTDV
jgi:hypothetical protein